MKNTTSLKLTKKLSTYGALVAAVGGVADASGQIIYTDISPDFAGGANSEYMLDIDNDGTDDFRIYNVSSSYVSNYGYSYNTNALFIEPLTASNDVLGSGGSTYAYPFALNSGDVISSTPTSGSWKNNGFAGGFNSLNYNSCDYGNWCNLTDGYLGLRFNIGGNTHYGWVRLDVSTAPDTYAIKDLAYNTIANESIEAGQTTLGIGENSLAELKIVSLNKSIALYNLPENTDYNLYSLTGQSLINGSINQDTYVIEANTASNGVYILELIDSDTKATIKKKVVL